MRRDSFVYALSGVFFGLIVGWIIGSQQAAGSASPAAAATTASAAPAPGPSATPPPLDTGKAAELERTAKAQPSNADVRIQLGNLYFDAERFDQAVPWYEAALALDPKNIDVSTDLGVCYYYTNEVDRALAQLDHSLALNPRHTKTLLNQGIVRAFGKQDLKGAVDSWQQVLAIAPNSEEGRRAQQAIDGIKSAHPGAGGAAGAGAGG